MNEETNLQISTQPPLVIPDVSNCPFSIVFNEDCVQGLKRFADNYFDLAIVDPPYMDGDNKALNTLGTNRLKFNIETFNSAPKQDYFTELFRVSKNQIVWGGNYFTDFLPVSRCWLMWDKIQDLAQFSDFELAWTSFDKVAKKIQESFKRWIFNKRNY